MTVSFDQMTAVHPAGLKLVAVPSPRPATCTDCVLWDRGLWREHSCAACQPSIRKDRLYIVWKEVKDG